MKRLTRWTGILQWLTVLAIAMSSTGLFLALSIGQKAPPVKCLFLLAAVLPGLCLALHARWTRKNTRRCPPA